MKNECVNWPCLGEDSTLAVAASSGERQKRPDDNHDDGEANAPAGHEHQRVLQHLRVVLQGVQVGHHVVHHRHLRRRAVLPQLEFQTQFESSSSHVAYQGGGGGGGEEEEEEEGGGGETGGGVRGGGGREEEEDGEDREEEANWQ